MSPLPYSWLPVAQSSQDDGDGIFDPARDTIRGTEVTDASGNYLFEDLAAGIQAALESDPENRSPRKMYALEIARLGSRLYNGEERVAWCGVTAPFDLLAAMGVTSCYVEFVGAMLAIDRPLDMCRTVLNVTGDATVATVVASSEGLVHEGERHHGDEG